MVAADAVDGVEVVADGLLGLGDGGLAFDIGLGDEIVNEENDRETSGEGESAGEGGGGEFPAAFFEDGTFVLAELLLDVLLDVAADAFFVGFGCPACFWVREPTDL